MSNESRRSCSNVPGYSTWLCDQHELGEHCTIYSTTHDISVRRRWKPVRSQNGATSAAMNRRGSASAVCTTATAIATATATATATAAATSSCKRAVPPVSASGEAASIGVARKRSWPRGKFATRGGLALQRGGGCHGDSSPRAAAAALDEPGNSARVRVSACPACARSVQDIVQIT